MIMRLAQKLILLRFWCAGALLFGGIMGLLSWPEQFDPDQGSNSKWLQSSSREPTEYELKALLAGWVGTDPEALTVQSKIPEQSEPLDHISLVGVVQVENDLVAHLISKNEGVLSVRSGGMVEPNVRVVEVAQDRVRLEYDSAKKMLELTLYPISHAQ